jgi:hypothetical protein
VLDVSRACLVIGSCISLIQERDAVVFLVRVSARAFALGETMVGKRFGTILLALLLEHELDYERMQEAKLPRTEAGDEDLAPGDDDPAGSEKSPDTSAGD